jgi:redox-sensitive bicupin YhaK (pirin superfamily)
MPFTILPVAKQSDGQFNGGAILEKKPVVLSHDGRSLTPYSNLFYWAHAWSDEGSTIGEHPHQGFEILSFVMKGGIEHYDSANKKWIPLNVGDVQIIRAGSGISHSEKILPGSAMFQIWFDPNLQKAILKTASYNDYLSSSFPVIMNSGYSTKILKGDGSPLEMDTPGIGIRQFKIHAGDFSISLEADKTYSIFVVDGTIDVDGSTLIKNDFLRIDAETVLNAKSFEGTVLFMIETPAQPGYPTYAARYMH